MTVTAGVVASHHLKTIASEATLGDASQLMRQESKRHLVVIDSQTRKIVGVISDRDIKKFISPFIGTPRETEQDRATLHIRIDRVIQKKVYAVVASEPLKHIVEKMLEKRIGSAVVIDSEEIPVAIITRTDILKVILNYL